MKANQSWVSKVLGESAPIQKPAPTLMRRVIGEEKDGEDDSAGKEEHEPESKEEHEPEHEPEGEAAHDEGEGDADVEMGGRDMVSGPVQSLISQWTSGGKMDVAMRLLNEPVTHSDFIELVFGIGEEDAAELGQIMDDLSVGEGEEFGAEDEGQDDVLGRVTDFEREGRDFRERHAEGDMDAINAAEQ